MEPQPQVSPPVWVEVIGRRGEVRARHAIAAWPCRIGRGYDMEVILDDPHVASCHAILDRGADGQITVSGPATHNGIQQGAQGKRLKRLAPQTPSVVSGEEVLRLGHTLLRVRPANYVVEPEQPIHNSWLRRDSTAYALVVIFLAMAALKQWLINWSGDGGNIFTEVVGHFIVLTAWVVAWGTAGRIIGGTALYWPHAAVTALAAIGVLLVELAVNVMTFSFGLEKRPEWLWMSLAVLLLGGMLYKQFQLASRRPRRTLAGYAALMAMSIFGLVTIPGMLKLDNREFTVYQEIVLSPQLLITSGIDPQAFIAQAREKVYADKREVK